MTLSRRDLGLAAAGTALVAGGCARFTPLAQRPARGGGKADPTTALLRRLTVEPTAADADSLGALGREGFVEEMLLAARPEPIGLALRLRRSDALALDSATLMDLPEPRVREGLQSAALLRACYGSNPLKERMAIFWGEHFNVFARKGDGTYYRGGEEERAIREEGLGSFPSLLLAVLEGPAMLGYLDAPSNRAGRPNENLGRELLELHTMGVGGGYSQKDVQEAARALTGWTIEDRFLRPRGRFRFDAAAHDSGPKVFLGRPIATFADERGVEEAREIARRAALHPATARRLARRLCLFFAGTSLPAVEAEMAKEFLASRGGIAPTLRPLLFSEELTTAAPVLRRPFELMVASIRATGAETDAGAPILAHLRRMGQPLYEWPMPDGYPLSERTGGGERAWGAGFAPRWAFAHALALGAIPGTSLPAGSDPAATAVTLAGPEFQWT